MKNKITILERIVALVLSFSFIFPFLPLEYIDLNLGTNFSRYNTFDTKAEALSYTYTGETITANVNTLAQITEYMATATENPNNLYVLTYTGNNALAITGTTTLSTEGHVKIVRGEGNKGQYMFNVTGTLNIGTDNMKGTIEIDGGATYTLDSSMTYNFETERPTGNGGNGTKNIKKVNGSTYVLFNDGNSYADAHWYKVGGVNSTYGLITNTGTLNIYDNVRIGNVYRETAFSDGNGGTINNPTGTVNMNGGEISWNAMGISNNGCGPAIYAGRPDGTGNNYTNGANAKVYINGGIISNNTALDLDKCSADGGAVSVDRGKLYINGGKITNNRSATGGSDKNGDGGGVMGRIGAEIYMYGGEISNNFSGSFGGGVLLWESKFHMYGGIITRNFARNGGGAGMSAQSGSEIYLYNDATITDNFAEYGGGLCVGSNGFATNCKLVVLNGNITNNTASVMGGGICNYNQTNCACDLRGGDISNNHSAKGAGLAIVNQSTNGTDYLLYLSGGIVINTNNDIYISKLNYKDTTSGTRYRNYQIPIKVIGRLTSSGTVGMITMDDFSTYVGTIRSGGYTYTKVTDLIKFERADGGSLEVQNNKFSIDTNQYILQENTDTNALRLTVNTGSGTTTSYVARVGSKVYSQLSDAIEAAQDGETVYIINNPTITETIIINKNLSICAETTKTKNDSNIIDGFIQNESGTTLTNFSYQPLGDYTISLASTFGTGSNTAGFVVKDGYTLNLGNSQYNENNVSISNSGFIVFDGNSGYEINGALFEVESGATLKANAGISITNNAISTGLNGAGVLVNGTFVLNGATIKNNESKNNGGAVYVSGNMQMLAGTIELNTATNNGAGIYVANNGSLSVSNGNVISNTASNNGGAIYVANGGIVLIDDIEINSNMATNNGAGVYIENGGTFTFNNGKIRSNQTRNGNGAGMYLLGTAHLLGGIISDNTISSYNSTPQGEGIYLNGTLGVSNSIKVTSDNPVYVVSGKYISIEELLLNSNAITIVAENTTDGTIVAKMAIDDPTRAESVRQLALSNKSIVDVDDRMIIGATISGESCLIYGSIHVYYDNNGSTSGQVPTDNNQYSGGDLVVTKKNEGENKLVKSNFVFLGWSTTESNPVASGVGELSLPIYYPEELVPGVFYRNDLHIYEDLTLYAVWAADSNNNGIPDYREDVLSITIEPTSLGSITSNTNEAQAGTLIMLIATPDEGYEVKNLEVKYTLNGIEETLSLENGKVVKLTDTYFYFNMPLSDATIYTTFGEQSKHSVRVTWVDKTGVESVEDFLTIQDAFNAMQTNVENDTYTPKKATMLRNTFSQDNAIVPSGMTFDFDLNGFTLDMNNYKFEISQNSSIRLIDNMTGGKMNFNGTSGGAGTQSGVINNGTLTIAGGQVTMEAGTNSVENLITNNGIMTITSGSVKHNSTNGTAIYNNGHLNVSGGNINGKKYGIYQGNTTDIVDSSTDVINLEHTFNLSGLGSEATYGINAANYISSIYVAKNAHINISGLLGNCSNDNIVGGNYKIKLFLDEAIQVEETILTSNKLSSMIEHFRTHFELQERSGYEIGINTSKQGVLVKKIVALNTMSVPENNTYAYRTPVTLKAKLEDSEGNNYSGASGKVYFFLFDKETAVDSWSKMWDDATKTFKLKDSSNESLGYYGIHDSVGNAVIDSTTGEATYTINNGSLDIKEYSIYAIFIGENSLSMYSDELDISNGYHGPVTVTSVGTFSVGAKSLTDSSITINSTESRSYTGQLQTVEIEVLDGTITLEKDVDYSVSISGVLVDAGTYQVTISGVPGGKYKDSVTKTFTINPYNDTITLEGIESRYNNVPNIEFEGSSANAFVKDAYGNVLTANTDYDYKYYKLNVLTNEYELVNNLSYALGIYKVIITGKAGGNYSEDIGAEGSFIISVDENADYDITIENETLTYNGQERTVSDLGNIVVKMVDTNTTLVRNQDYVAMFGVSHVKDAGNYTLVIQGVGDYSSLSLAKTITINKKLINSSNTTITFADDEYYYTGKARIPQIVSISIDGVNLSGDNGGTPIIKDTDYITSITGDNINVGTPRFTLTALNGNYAGSIDLDFEIQPRDINSNEISVSIYQVGFTGNEIIPTITVVDEVTGTQKVLAQGLNQDYTVTYKVDTEANDGAKLSPNGYPLNKGTYNVEITGAGNYTQTRVEELVIGNYKGKIIATLEPNAYTYAGNSNLLSDSIIQALSVVRGTDGEVLVRNTDFTIGFNSPVNTTVPSEVGEYSLYVVGIGNYEGTQTTVPFTISPLTGTIHLELVSDKLTYNGKVQYPAIDVNESYLSIDGEDIYLKDLTENDDYVIVSDNNSKNIGAYMLQVNGVGAYAGNYNYTNYQIVAKSLADSDISINSSGTVSKTYDGTEQELDLTAEGDAWVEFTISEDESVLLEEDTDYTTIYTNNVNAGTASLVFVGKGNFKEAKAYTFNIDKRSIGNGEIAQGFTLSGNNDVPYTGTATSLNLVLKDDTLNKTLVKGDDYEVSYSNNIDVGEATYTVTGKGNYIGTITGTYNVLMSHTISMTGPETYEHTGEPIISLVTVKDSLNHLLGGIDYSLTYYVDEECKTKTTTANSGSLSEGSEPVESGTYYRKVVGTSTNYLGLTATQEITILPHKTTSANISISNTNYDYDGDIHSATIELKDSDGNTIPNTEYNVTYYTNSELTTPTGASDGAQSAGGAPSNAGDYYVRVVGLNDYEGYDSNSTFVINKLRIQNLDISEVADATYTGSAITPKPTVSWKKGETTVSLVEGTDYEYEYQNNINAGEAIVIVKATSNSRNYAGSATIAFKILSATDIEVTLENDEVTYNGEVQKPQLSDIYIGSQSLEQLNLAGSNYTVEYGTGDYKQVGNYELTVKLLNGGVTLQEKTVNYRITNKELIVTPNNNQQKVYGSQDEPITFTTNISTTSGLYGIDEFTGALSRAKGEDVDEYEINIGSLQATNYNITFTSGEKYKIIAKDISDDNVEISGVETEYTYTGSAITPNVRIVYSSSKGKIALDSGVDYDLITYELYDATNNAWNIVSNSKEVGKYRLTVQGKGNYTGSKKVVYDITAMKSFNASFTNISKEFNRNIQNPTVKVTSITGTLVENTDYRLVYYLDNTHSQKTNIGDRSGARTEGGAPANVGNYYLRVEGLGNYVGCVAESEFRITSKNIQDKSNSVDYDISILDILDQTFSGTAITPEPTISWNGVALGTQDYELTYSNNENAGVATITVTGKGNYVGTRTIDFNIVANASGDIIVVLKDENDVVVDETSSSYTYDGTSHVANVEVTLELDDRTVELREGSDYTLAYGNTTDAGLVSVQVLLTGNYAGSVEKKYLIKPRSLNDTTININPEIATFNGSEQRPDVRITYGDMQLTEGIDYTVAFGEGNFISKGAYNLVITASNSNYTGEVTKGFSIEPYGSKAFEVLHIDYVGDVSSYLAEEFTESDFRSNLIVKDVDGNVLRESEYNVEFKRESDTTYQPTASTQVGKYIVKVSGKEDTNYEGTYAVGERGYVLFTRSLSADLIAVDYDGLVHTISNNDIVVKAPNNEILSSGDFEVSFGSIEVKEAGNYTIFITGKNDFAGATGSSTYRINPAQFTVSSVPSKEYDGQSSEIALNVVGINNAQIALGKDYYVIYKGTTEAGSYYSSNKVPKEAGEYTIYLYGRGNYSGCEKETPYVITPKSLQDSDIEVKVLNNELVYNGLSRQANIEIRYNLSDISLKLNADVDYSITSETEYKNAGEYTITIEAEEGNYVDSTSGTFTILPYTGKLQTSMTGTVFNYGTTFESIKDDLVVKYNSETLTSNMYDIVAYPAVSSIPEVGNYTLTITAKTANYSDGTNKASAEVKFAIVPASELRLTFANSTVTYNGTVQKPSSGDIFVGTKSLSTWAQEGRVYEVNYGEGNYKDAGSYMIKATYSEDGILIEQNLGTYTIENAQVLITPDSGLYKEYGQLDTEITYTTNISDGTHGLYGDDSFSEELVRVQGENVGQYEIKQNGIYANNYDIEVTSGVKYEIKPKNIDATDIEVTGVNSSYTFTGTTIKPTVMVVYNSPKFGNLALVQNEDFKVKYQKYNETTEEFEDISADNELINVGKYRVVVTGLSNYTGTYTCEYNISSYVTSFVAIVSNNNKTYNKSVQRATVEVTGSNSVLVEGVDYKVVYYVDNAYTTKTNTTRELGGAEEEGGAPRHAGTYYIGVEGVGNYTGSSSRATFVINPKPISAQEIQFTPISAQTYTGSNIEPTVILAWGVGLVEDRDFEVTYKNNTNIGKADITINGIGNYSESRNESFEITPIADGEIEIVLSQDSYTYDGTAKEPEVTVNYTIDGEKVTLHAETDYDVSYSNNVNSGIATVSVTLTGVYYGTKSENFEITAYNLENATLTIIPSSNSYNGKNQSVSIAVNALDKLLVKGVDYTVTIPTTMKNAGEYTITVTGIEDSNYTGTKTGSFTINKYGLNEEDTLLLEFANENSSYKEGITKSEFESNLVVKDLNRNTLTSSDYVVTYSSDNETFTSNFPELSGTYTVKVTGTGTNYAGQNDVATRKFNIHVDKVDVTDVSKVYKNQAYTIADILADITITSDVGTELPKNSFDITFGKENPTNVGSYTILAQGKTNTEYYGINGAGTFTITQADIVLNSASDVTYTGSSIEPTLSVTGVNNEEVRIGRDYEISYTGTDIIGNTYNSTTAPVKVGSYTVTIKGNGNYKGTSSKNYNVKPVNMNSNSFRVEITNNNAIYNTAIQPPQVAVYFDTVSGTIKLTEGVDYELDNGTNTYKNAGTYNIKVKALTTSNYSNNKDISYVIKPYTGTLDVVLSETSFESGVTEDKILNKATVKYLNDTIPLSDLEIIFTPEELIKGNYTVQFNAQSSMKNYYLNASSKANGYAIFTIQEAEEINLSLDETTHVYTAKTITVSEDTIKINGKSIPTLRRENPNLTYEVEWNDTLKDVGNYTVTVKILKNNSLLQQASAFYKITPKDISETDVIAKEILSKPYTGSEIVPEVKLTYNGVSLTEDDFTAVYKDNKNVGEATITIVGTNNYKGTRELKFNILEATNIDAEITLLEGTNVVTNETYTYDGTSKKPNVLVKATLDGEDITLAENESYILTYGDTVNAGTVGVLVTFIGNYSGNMTTSYVINPRNINEVTVNQNPIFSIYNKKVIKPTFTLTYNDLLLNEGRDYELDYGTLNYKDAGNYTITITGITGNYTGTITKTFDIYKYGLNENEYLTFDINGETTFLSNEFNKDSFENTFVVKDLNGNTLTSDEYTISYASLDDMVFSSEPGTSIGTYVVRVQGVGNYKDTYAKAQREYVLCTEKLLVDDVTSTYNGQAKTISANDVTVKTSGGTVLESSQYDVSFGTAEVKEVGSYTLIVKGKAQASGAMGTATYKVVPTAFTVSDLNSATYTGVRNKPDIVVKGIGNAVLTENVDYTVSYTGENYAEQTYENIEAPIDAGEYEVIITGKGNYSGTVRKDFIVEKASLTNAVITLDKDELIYNGNSQIPIEVVTYTIDGRKQALVNLIDYKLTYEKYDEEDDSFSAIDKSKSKNTGDYRIVAEGLGNFKDTKSIEYEIVPYKVELNVDYSNTSVTYNKSAQEVGISVTGMGEELVVNRDYVVTYYTNSECTTKTTPENSGTTVEGGAPVNSGKYYVMVSGLGNYAGSSSKSQFTISPKDITSNDISFENIASKTYTGEEIEPSIVANWGTYTLVSDTDFEVTYSNNIALGTANIKVEGIGNYAGTKDLTFSIVAISEGEITIKLYESGELVTDNTYTYDGMPKNPTIEVIHSNGTEEKTLTQGTDYSYTYTNNINSGTASVNIVLKGNYSGNERKEFKINKFDLSNAIVTLSNDVVYNGKEQKPQVTAKQNATLLILDRDYTITYEEGFVEAGTYDVTITAVETSNYKGTNTSEFKISKYGIDVDDVLSLEFKNGEASFVEHTTKETFEENLIVKDLNRNTLDSNEYTVLYSTDGTNYSGDFPEDAGSYSVKVTGKGNNYASTNDVATRDFVIFIELVEANDISKTYKGTAYTIDDIISELELASDLGTELDKSKFDISFGKSTPKEVGTYTILIAGKSDDIYSGLLGTAEFKIEPSTTFTVQNIDDQVYTGSTIDVPVVVNGVSGEELVLGKDYEITYTGTDSNGDDYESSTAPNKVGEYEVKVTGKGNYDGASITKEFEITKVQDADLDATLSQTEFMFNGEGQVPTEAVKYVSTDNTLVLTKDVDYTVSYKNSSGTTISKDYSKEVGDYKVVITLKGSYDGEIELDYSITTYLSGFNVTIENSNKEYNGDNQEIELVVKNAKGDELTEDTDYKVTYYTDSAMTTKTSSSDGAETAGGAPSESGKYYVQVSGIGNYDGSTSSSTFVIAKKSIDDLTISSIPDQLYDGSEKEPAITIKDGSETISSSDYTVTYRNNTEMGTDTASATITMKESSNYKGTKVVYFSIVTDPDDEAEITLLDGNGDTVENTTYTYDGTEKKPRVVVSKSGKTLVQDTDYTVTYSNNKSAGDATVKVTFKGNYSGSSTKTFKINPLNLSNCEVSLKPENATYTGSDIKPTATVTYETDDGKFIKLNSSDYEVVYPEASKAVGTYTVTIKPKNANITGSATVTFTVKKSDSSGGGGRSTKVIKVTVTPSPTPTSTPKSGDIVKPDESQTILDKVNHNSYITGYDDNTFRPDRSMTRAEVVTVFTRLLKEKPEVDVKDNPFTDIDNHWAKESILIMNSLGIVKGYDDQTFKPENMITRAEFATMISRFDNIVNIQMNTNFYDVPEDHWAYSTINYARYMGWISGYADGSFKPNNRITRAEAITIINRMLGRSGDIDTINEQPSMNKFIDIADHWAYYGIIEATIAHEYEMISKIEIWKS